MVVLIGRGGRYGSGATWTIASAGAGAPPSASSPPPPPVVVVVVVPAPLAAVGRVPASPAP
ncbi:MAG: hypothetical protein ACRDZR_09890 [Acidimicrobiales bacterium]